MIIPIDQFQDTPEQKARHGSSNRRTDLHKHYHITMLIISMSVSFLKFEPSTQ